VAGSFRDRFFTRKTAEAITSPSGILLAGAGISAGILAGAPLLACAGLGAVLWGGRVLLGMPRGRGKAKIDPFALGEPWRQFVQEALQAQNRFRQAVQTAEAGPLRDRLTEIGDRIATGVEECWKVAKRGDLLANARQQIDVPRIQAELQSATANADAPWAAGSALEDRVEALQSQLGSAQRMETVISDAGTRLQVLDARLDEAVTRAIELSVQASDTSDLGGLGSDVDAMVEEMEALRLALEETSGRAAPLPPAPAPSADAAPDTEPGSTTA
jgi:hypothetical protein